jgi:outer membrane lipoprotein SlyB
MIASSKIMHAVRCCTGLATTNKETTMSTPQNTSKQHPMMIVAAVAVALFCAVGIAAMMDWLPASIGGNSSSSDAQIEAKQTQSQMPPEEKSPTSTPAPDRVAAPPPCSNCGVIDSIRTVDNRAEGSGVGAAGGAVLGGVLGNQVGGGTGKQLATIAGAIGGAVVGNQVEGRVNATRSYVVTVRMDNGSTRTINQTAQPRWGSGDEVRIVDGQIRSND